MRSAAIRDVNFNLGEDDDGGDGGGGREGGRAGEDGGSFIRQMGARARSPPFATLTTFLLFGRTRRPITTSRRA